MLDRMRIDEIRRARGYSQEFMANRLGCHRITYAKMEENPQHITMSNAYKIAEILGVTLDDIIFLESNLQNVE